MHVAVATLRAVVVGLRFTHIAARSDSHAWQRRAANLQYGGLEGRSTLRHNIPHGASPLPSGTVQAVIGLLRSQPNEVVDCRNMIYIYIHKRVRVRREFATHISYLALASGDIVGMALFEQSFASTVAVGSFTQASTSA